MKEKRVRCIRMFFLILPLVLSVVSFLALPTYAGEVKPLKIGCVTSLTGPASAWGQQTATVLKWAVKQVNEGGGIKSMGGAKVEAIISDCESEAKKVVTEVEKMFMRHKPNAMLSVSNSPLTKTALPICQRYKIPIAGIEYGDELFDMRNPFWFGTSSRASMISTQMAKFIIETGKKTGYPVKTAGLLFQDGAFGEASHDALMKYLPANGVKVVVHGMFPPGKISDFSDTFSRWKARKPDVAFFGCPPHDGVLINKGMRAADFNPLGFAFCSTIIGTPDYKNLGKYAEHTFGTPLFSEHALRNIKGALEYKNEFYSKMGEKGKIVSIPWLFMLTQSIGTIINGIEKAASYDTVSIRDAIKGISLRAGEDKLIYLPDGVKFDETGCNIMAKWTGGQLQNLKAVVLYPQAIASPNDKPVWPVPKWRER